MVGDEEQEEQEPAREDEKEKQCREQGCRLDEEDRGPWRRRRTPKGQRIHALGRIRALQDTDGNAVDILAISRDDERIDTILTTVMNQRIKNK